MKTLRILMFGLLVTLAIVCRAQITEPGWYDASSFVNPLLGNGGNFVTAQTNLIQGQMVETLFPQGTTAIAEAITPEIQSLARGLENDPLRIFDYVHDHIRHVLYFGSKKGAQLTLLERSGNDFDQCALLVALLSAAGYSNNVGYQFGMLQMPYDSADHNDVHHWLGLDLVNTNWLTTSNYFSTLLAGRGYPLFYCIDNTNTLAFPRVWVTLNVNGTNYNLDPAFKISEPVSGIDLPVAMGYADSASLSNALMTAAGGTNTADYVRNLNESALRSKLQSCNTNLLLTLQNNHPNASVEQILGGREILPWTNALNQTLMFSTFTDHGKVPVQNWTYQPTEFMSMIQISWLSYFGTVGKGWYYPQLQGMRLSLTCSNAGYPIYNIGLWEGDSCHVLASTLNSSFPLTVTIIHPYGGWDTNNNVPVDTGYLDSCVTNTYQANNAYYAFDYAFEPDQAWLRERQQQLDTYRQQGCADNSREVITETLNVMGLNWMIQTEMSMDLLAQQGHTLHQFHDRFGRMAQESGRGYYIDAYLQLSGESPSTGATAADFLRRNQVISVSSYIRSAQEHAIIEQLQSNNLVGASTMKILQLANTNGQAIYLANSNNWTANANVRNQLVNYNLSTFDGLISKGYSLLLPTNGAIPIAGNGSWTGQGYVEQLAGSSYGLIVGMIIGGGYSGGYVSASTAIPNPSFVSWFNQANPFYVNSYPSFTHVTLAGDPVNMADASFRVNATDLSVGGKEPLGMTVSRSYTPTRRHLNQANMADGWMHNYCFNLDEISAPEASLGGTTPAQMAPMLVATCAALNIFQLQPDPKNWMVTALTAKWGIDQTISNAVSIVLGNDTIQFVKQPDGSFTPPANCTLTLTKGSTYALQERHGNIFNFNSSKQLASIVDPFGNTLNLTYTSSLLSQVSDWKSRTLTFTYSGTPSHLDKITDNSSPTRSVSFGYLANTDGNPDLVSVTDPEGKTSTYGYDANHQITATSNALNQLVVSNLYDGFGHVTTQYTQGDTNKTWQIYWSGWQTVAQDPAGGKHRYCYDDKTRQIGGQDELGNLSQTFYDGQDHVVMTISPLNETNQFVYDGNNNLIYSIDPLGFTNQFIYDTNNNLIKTIDPLKNPCTFGYNAQFSLTGATNGAGDWVNYSYTTSGSLAGTLASRTDSGGTTQYGYDSTYGQLNSITNPGSLGVEHFVISAQGDMTSHTDARGFNTTFQYNLRRQLTNCIAPTNLTIKLAYDAVGNLQTVTDARTNTASITWSVTRHLLAMTLPSTPLGAPMITNAYDNRDWLTQRLIR